MPNPKLETYKNKATGTVYDYTDAAAQAALADILDGTDIDSFGDVETALATKVDKVTGKGLSTNDYDDTEKAKVAGAFPRSEQAVLGATNLLPIEANKDIKVTVGSTNYNFNVDSNYYMSCSDADTRDENTVGAIYTNSQVKFNLPKGDYIWRIEEGTPNTGSALRFLMVSATAVFVAQSEVGEFRFSLSEDTALGMFAKVRRGSYRFSITPVGFKDIPFVPYAMTNKELTEKVQGIIDAATNAADFAAFKTAISAL